MSMEYKLPRPVYTKSLSKIISREIKRQKIDLDALDEEQMEELVAISKVISEKGLPENLVLKKLPKKVGYGIFLHPEAKPIPRFALIAPYSGKLSLTSKSKPLESDYTFSPITDIILNKEEQKSLGNVASYNARRLYELNVDAFDEGNFTRYINHSEEPNVEALLLSTPKNSFGLERLPIEVVYSAKRTIYPGEQLLVCYEDDDNDEDCYWGPQGIEPFEMTPRTFMLDASLNLIKCH